MNAEPTHTNYRDRKLTQQEISRAIEQVFYDARTNGNPSSIAYNFIDICIAIDNVSRNSFLASSMINASTVAYVIDSMKWPIYMKRDVIHILDIPDTSHFK